MVIIRNPQAIRPWQHVLEPLSGYLLLAQKLYVDGPSYAGAWNFGPTDSDARPVEWLVKALCKKWGGNTSYLVDGGQHPHEAHYLKLDCSKATSELGWEPKWNLEQAIDSIIEWTKAYAGKEDVTAVCMRQLADYIHAGELKV
jgi:CDP-glucose 4,6-dehydratase